MTTLREAAQQALEACKLIVSAFDALKPASAARNEPLQINAARASITALEAALAEPVQEPVECEPQYANEDGWCDWVCPKPTGYLMQCCDCGLIHEVDFRVAKYQPLPSEAFEVVDDPDLQAQWRMKRRDDISPKQAPQRPAEPVQEPDSPERRCGGPGCDMRCCQPVQEPVAWADKISFESAMKIGKGHDVWPKAGDYETRTGRALIGLYTSPPQRPAEPQEPFALPCPTPKACKAHCCSGNCIPRSKA